ncbi:MAG: hypothetical protein K2X87_17840 [Gemmataceae bacterium]|nr:hypothetical protein [Gemmataceae bacterium]
MRRRILLSAGLFALTAALGLTGCDEPKSTDTGRPDKPTIEKSTKNGKGKIASDEMPPPPTR